MPLAASGRAASAWAKVRTAATAGSPARAGTSAASARADQPRSCRAPYQRRTALEAQMPSTPCSAIAPVAAAAATRRVTGRSGSTRDSAPTATATWAVRRTVVQVAGATLRRSRTARTTPTPTRAPRSSSAGSARKSPKVSGTAVKDTSRTRPRSRSGVADHSVTPKSPASSHHGMVSRGASPSGRCAVAAASSTRQARAATSRPSRAAAGRPRDTPTVTPTLSAGQRRCVALRRPIRVDIRSGRCRSTAVATR